MSTIPVSAAPSTVLRVAIIGSGPGGMFAAAALLKQDSVPVEVDIYERLFTPFGLVRHGVAPDHAKLKSVAKAFDRTLQDPRVTFFGDVEVGTDVELDELRREYDAVVIAVGGVLGRSLGVPGESLTGVYSAADFAAWYNGHPDQDGAEFDLSGSRVVVVGNGNVALDVSRVLARTGSELLATDVAADALKALDDAGVSEILVIGRRGPGDVSFTQHELHELADLADADVTVEPDPDVLAELDTESDSWQTKAFAEYLRREPRSARRAIRFAFHRQITEILGDGTVSGVRLSHTGAAGDATVEEVPASLVLIAIGTDSRPLADLAFDGRAGRLFADGGRLTDPDGTSQAGLYVTGWARRGATGIIGTNRRDAGEVVDALLADRAAGVVTTGAAEVPAGLHALRQRIVLRGAVSTAHWRQIDTIETDRGAERGRPRLKLTRREHFRDVLALVDPVAEPGSSAPESPAPESDASDESDDPATAPVPAPSTATHNGKWVSLSAPQPDSEAEWVYNSYVGDVEIALTRVESEWFAFADRCSHADCSLSDFSEVVGDRLVCNCHGSAFDLRTGVPFNPPATEPLAKIDVRVAGDRLEVFLAED